MGKVDLRIDAEILEKARAVGLDAAGIAEKALRAAVDSAQAVTAEDWARKNADALEDHRRRIAAYGVFGDDLRTW